MAPILTTRMLLIKEVGKRPFYMANDSISANSKKRYELYAAGEADSDDSVDDQSDRLDALGDDNVVAGDETDAFKEIPKKGLNKAEEAEYAQHYG